MRERESAAPRAEGETGDEFNSAVHALQRLLDAAAVSASGKSVDVWACDDDDSTAVPPFYFYY